VTLIHTRIIFDYAIPGNDDAVRSISFSWDLIGSAILSGMEENLNETGVEISEPGH
jgi:Ribosomal protein S2